MWGCHPSLTPYNNPLPKPSTHETLDTVGNRSTMVENWGLTPAQQAQVQIWRRWPMGIFFRRKKKETHQSTQEEKEKTEEPGKLPPREENDTGSDNGGGDGGDGG
jgi:hypothetical protein